MPTAMKIISSRSYLALSSPLPKGFFYDVVCHVPHVTQYFLEMLYIVVDILRNIEYINIIILMSPFKYMLDTDFF